MNKCYDVVTLGELLLRLDSSDSEPLSRGMTLKKYAGGAELNVAAGVSALGLKTAVISRIPENPLGEFVRGQAVRLGVSDEGFILDHTPEARLGVYYSQSGVAPRKPTVIYDRAASSFTGIQADELPMELLDSARLFHTTGITLALGANVRETAASCMKRCKEQGVLVSFDVNYRETLWSEQSARKAIEEILPYVDILFVSEETSRRMFGKTGMLAEIQHSFCSEYGISAVLSTERKIISPSEQCFGSSAYNAKTEQVFREPPYEHIQVLDRIGSGDAFVAGALFSLLKYDSLAEAIRIGNAMAAVKSTVHGDLPETGLTQIQKITDIHNATDVQSEMNR